jgi:hypothetical protein
LTLVESGLMAMMLFFVPARGNLRLFSQDNPSLPGSFYWLIALYGYLTAILKAGFAAKVTNHKPTSATSCLPLPGHDQNSTHPLNSKPTRIACY